MDARSARAPRRRRQWRRREMTATVRGRLLLDDRVVPSEVEIEDGVIVAVQEDERAASVP